MKFIQEKSTPSNILDIKYIRGKFFIYQLDQLNKNQSYLLIASISYKLKSAKIF